MTTTVEQDRATSIEEHLNEACRKIAPLWPLENFVAVNPYLGLTDLSFEEAAHRLHATGGISTTMPLSFYLKAWQQGDIRPEDIQAVLESNPKLTSWNYEEFLNILNDVGSDSQNTGKHIKSYTDVAQEITGKDWNRLFVDSITSWASTYFDNGQAIWKSQSLSKNIYQAWKEEASTDRTPNLMGLSGFTSIVSGLPNNPLEAATLIMRELDIPEQGRSHYLHRMLLRVNGWSAYAAYLDWQEKLNNNTGRNLYELLVVYLSWEYALRQALNHPDVESKWLSTRFQLSNQASNDELNIALQIRLILQNAYELKARNQILSSLQHSFQQKPMTKSTPEVQAVFCIDVRSEVYRRNLELVNDEIETLGFAGFFGFPVHYIPTGSEQGNDRCPALLPAGYTLNETFPDEDQHQQQILRKKTKRFVHNSWDLFKHGAISCFSFMGAIGLAYLPKLFKDSFPHTGHISQNSHKHQSPLNGASEHIDTSAIPFDDQVIMARSALRAMSLTSNFADLVLIVGHGASNVNNPHASGLDCGACGGQSGEINAMIAATVLNNQEVRNALIRDDIKIPESTWFVACKHDTTTDVVHILQNNTIPTRFKDQLAELRESLQQAGQAARTERATRFQFGNRLNTHKSVDQILFNRSKDWSQVRPEWGLAGCAHFIAAPRWRTKQADLKGRTFLHTYDWENDEHFTVLEQIMTAPVVVASWINLQYYGSTVDNIHHGSGNKTLHNVTGGIGVLEGYAGDLRTGLPWQSIHDGDEYQHKPQRLHVIIEAPVTAIDAVLEQHPQVRELFEHRWLFLTAIDRENNQLLQYTSDSTWIAVT